jgi:hypothetical protein
MTLNYDIINAALPYGYASILQVAYRSSSSTSQAAQFGSQVTADVIPGFLILHEQIKEYKSFHARSCM